MELFLPAFRLKPSYGATNVSSLRDFSLISKITNTNNKKGSKTKPINLVIPVYNILV